jgi:hypothetical protein
LDKKLRLLGHAMSRQIAKSKNPIAIGNFSGGLAASPL